MPRNIAISGDGSGEGEQLSPSQQALLRDFSVQAGRPAINRPFSLVRGLPSRLERKGVVLESNITDAELLSLARQEYIDYGSQDDTITFRAKAYDQKSQVTSMPKYHISSKGMRAGKLSLAFGKHRALTIVRPIFVTVALAILLMYLLGYLSAAAVGTWTAIIGLIIATIVLQIPQRGNK